MATITTPPYSHQLLPHVFEKRAKLDPEGVFAKFPVLSTSYDAGFQSMTHLQTLNAINHVAWSLEKCFGKSRNFETIAYLGPNDPRYHIVLIAAIKVGYKIFLPSPRNSKAAHISLLSILKCTKLVCTNPEVPAIQTILEDYAMEKLSIPSLQELISYHSTENYPYEKSFEIEKDNPIFVLHTSGSTGFPKPLTYSHEFVTRIVNVNLLAPPEGYMVLDAGYRSGTFYISLPSFHIAGIGFSLIIPSFFGCIPVFPLPSGPPTIESFIGAVKHGDFEWAFLPPVVIDDLSRDLTSLELVASKLNYLYYVGGSLPQAAGDFVCEKLPVYQALGSSECSVFPLLRPKNDHTLTDWNYLQIHPSLQTEFQHRFEDLYELVVVKREDYEYLQPAFVHFPELNQYETRDLFTPHDTKPGLWKHRSRIDDVIVFINGEKTNPISFEAEVASHPEVRSALVVGQQRFEASLLVEPVDSKTLSKEDKNAFKNRIWHIVQSANTKCPAHARVSKSKILLTDPDKPMLRAGKGTVMRQATLTSYQEKLDDLYSADSKDALSAVVDLSDLEAVTNTIHHLVMDITEWISLDNDTDFFSLGMDSLQVLRIVQKLKIKLGSQESLSPSTIYINPSVKSLAEALHNDITKEADVKSNLQESRQELLFELRIKYEKEIDLLVSGGIKSRGDQMYEHPVILLTGSTGALGSYILQSLLLNNNVAHIYCLNRAQNSKSVQQTRNAERSLRADFPPSRVTFLTCDLLASEFGVDKSVYEKMLSTVTHIIHNAWPVNFNQTLKSFQPSLDGVLSLISFSAHAKLSPAILFLSSISSAVNYRNKAGTKALIPESVLFDDSSPANMGYGESKYVAERMLNYAATKLKIAIGIVRIGQIAGTANNPRGWNRNEWLPSLVLSSHYLGALPDALGLKRLNSSGVMSNITWIPIDLLAGILIELTFGLGRNKKSLDGACVYHAVNPQSVTWDALLPTIKETLQRKISVSSEAKDIKIIPLVAWVKLLKGTATSKIDTEAIYQNPGVKLMGFYESLLISDETAPSCSFDTLITSQTSKSFEKLEPIRAEWMAGWVKDWVSSLRSPSGSIK